MILEEMANFQKVNFTESTCKKHQSWPLGPFMYGLTFLKLTISRSTFKGYCFDDA
jgi:hypothetical protein